MSKTNFEAIAAGAQELGAVLAFPPDIRSAVGHGISKAVL